MRNKLKQKKKSTRMPAMFTVMMPQQEWFERVLRKEVDKFNKKIFSKGVRVTGIEFDIEFKKMIYGSDYGAIVIKGEEKRKIKA